MSEYQKDLLELAYYKKCFRESKNRAMWKECIKVERIAKASSKEDAKMIVRHAIEVIHKYFKRG